MPIRYSEERHVAIYVRPSRYKTVPATALSISSQGGIQHCLKLKSKRPTGRVTCCLELFRSCAAISGCCGVRVYSTECMDSRHQGYVHVLIEMKSNTFLPPFVIVIMTKPEQELSGRAAWPSIEGILQWAVDDSAPISVVEHRWGSATQAPRIDHKLTLGLEARNQCSPCISPPSAPNRSSESRNPAKYWHRSN